MVQPDPQSPPEAVFTRVWPVSAQQLTSDPHAKQIPRGSETFHQGPEASRWPKPPVGPHSLPVRHPCLHRPRWGWPSPQLSLPARSQPSLPSSHRQTPSGPPCPLPPLRTGGASTPGPRLCFQRRQDSDSSPRALSVPLPCLGARGPSSTTTRVTHTPPPGSQGCRHQRSVRRTRQWSSLPQRCLALPQGCFQSAGVSFALWGKERLCGGHRDQDGVSQPHKGRPDPQRHPRHQRFYVANRHKTQDEL